MTYHLRYPYSEAQDPASVPQEFMTGDHLFGFGPNMENSVLERLDRYASDNGFQYRLVTDQYYDDRVRLAYPNIEFVFDHDMFGKYNLWTSFHEYRIHPDIKFENFLCCFNGSAHVSRQLLTAALARVGWFDWDTCTKNFICDAHDIDGHLQALVPDTHRYHRKFFINDDDHSFFGMQSAEEPNHRFDHQTNIYRLEQRLTSSFVNLISESMATSYYPFFTDKFLYSVVTRGLFVAFAQPGWHQRLEQVFGFRRFSNIFDYQFDSIGNPIDRLLGLLGMISRFANLTVHDWHDLYLMEQDAIEHNHHWYHSRGYLDHLKKTLVSQ